MGNGSHQPCTHAFTDEHKAIAEVLLDQVHILRTTDLDHGGNLELVRANIDKIEFVRNKNYLEHMSDIVQKQDSEIAQLQYQLSIKSAVEQENSVLKETVLT